MDGILLIFVVVVVISHLPLICDILVDNHHPMAEIETIAVHEYQMF